MAKVKRDEAAGSDLSAQKKIKKKKSTVSVDGQAEAAQVAGNAADGDVEKKVLLSPIAVPLADAKLKKRTLKLVKKAAIGKQLKRGVKEVVKALRKGSKG